MATWKEKVIFVDFNKMMLRNIQKGDMWFWAKWWKFSEFFNFRAQKNKKYVLYDSKNILIVFLDANLTKK